MLEGDEASLKRVGECGGDVNFNFDILKQGLLLLQQLGEFPCLGDNFVGECGVFMNF